MRILMIGDQVSPHEEAVSYLRQQGFDLILEDSVETAIECLYDNVFSLILLQANANCVALLKQIRRVSQISVMVIAESVDTCMRMNLYKHGVDDYVGTWLNHSELQFRVFALLRRSNMVSPGNKSANYDTHILEVDDLQLDSKTHAAKLANIEMELTPVQFRLLWTMASNKDKVLSKPFLYRVLFDREYSVYDRGVDIHVSRVRKKLDLAGGASRRVLTVHGKGYCFV